MVQVQSGRRPAAPRRTQVLTAAAASLLAAVPVLAAAGCASMASGAAMATAAPPAAATVPQQPAARATAGPGASAGGRTALAVLSASFPSASDGWLLAVPRCSRAARPCRRLLLRRTADGGRNWSVLPAPPMQASPPAGGEDAVGNILFTRTGLGWAWGPGLWQTSDAGRTWHRLVPPGGLVQNLAVAGGRLLAVTGRCGANSGQCRFQVYSAPAGTVPAGPGGWRLVPGASGIGSGPATLTLPTLTASGQTGYLLAGAVNLGGPLLLTGPVNGAARWQPLPVPCRAWSAALAAAGGWLFLACGSEPGAGSQLKTAYLSRDGGRHWQRVASPPVSGYVGAASMTAAGTVFLSGGRMTIYVSPDRGRSWQQSPDLAGAAGLADAGFGLRAAAVTTTWGFAIQQGVFRRQLWLTRDAGQHWTPVTVR